MPSMEDKKKFHFPKLSPPLSTTANSEVLNWRNSGTEPLPREEEMVSSSYMKFNGVSPMVDAAFSPNVASSSEDFFETQELISAASTSSVEADDNSFKPNTPRAEFFDAPEDAFELLSTENTPQISPCNVETDLEIREEEIEKRKKAEETRDILRKHWERLAQKLSQEGLTLAAAPSIEEDPELDPATELCRQISYARDVSTCIGKETAKADAEMELESRIMSKDCEIARLQQRLHYHETVNHEMVLRNQQAVEMTHGPRKRSKKRKRWIWSTLGVTIVVGSVALAWHFYSNARVTLPTDALPEGQAAGNESK